MGNLIAWFDSQFARLYTDWREVIEQVEPQDLYRTIAGSQSASVGDCVVRSARAVEQTFGGITANLWDDPFEWTLPESLTRHEKLLEYFGEVEATRRRGFEFFQADDDLLKEIMTPAGETQPATLLLETLVRARLFHLKGVEASKEITKNRQRTQIAPNPA